jgi:Glycosyl transferases group 1
LKPVGLNNLQTCTEGGGLEPAPEIAGGFLLAKRRPGHLAAVEKDNEAVFLSSVEECAEEAGYCLNHEAERETIPAVEESAPFRLRQ